MKPILTAALVVAVALLLPIARAAAPVPAADVQAAVADGGLPALQERLGGWIAERVPADPAAIDEAALRKLLADPALGLALAQRQFLVKAGAVELAAFAAADPANREFLGWLLSDRTALEEILDAATPVRISARAADSWSIPRAVLDRWRTIDSADRDARRGLPLRLAIATALRPPGTGAPGSGQKRPPSGPLERYEYFKRTHAAGELFPSFDRLTGWDLQFVVSSGASEEDLDWGRKMVRTWMPQLLDGERVVETTSQVWRRNSPIPHVDYKAVLDGGGKCGPRSSWAVFICQAFGIPAIGVGQPRHACVAYKGVDGRWQVAYGRGWNASSLEGMSGQEFVEGTLSRSRRGTFELIERARWLAGALDRAARSAAVTEVARAIDASTAPAPVDLAASQRADEADADGGNAGPLQAAGAAAAKAAAEPAPPGVIRVMADSFIAQGGNNAFGGQFAGVPVVDSFGGGRQILFQALMPSAWVGYEIDVPETGLYRLTVRAATANSGQYLHVRSFGAMLRPAGATVTNVFHNMVKDLGAQMAIDDNPGTRWAANEGVDQCTLEIDLGAPQSISTCMIDERQFNRVSKFVVEYQDGADWKTLFEGENIGIGFVQDFSPVTTQRVRLRTLDCRERGGPTIWEFAVGTEKDGQAFLPLPCSHGLWQDSEPVDIRLVKGKRTLWLFAPFQRGVALKSFDLVRKAD